MLRSLADETDPAALGAAVEDSEPQHPQHLLLTLLGDYWMAEGAVVPSAALVTLLAEFGISTPGARAALSRLARRDLMAADKIGRRTYYRLTERARRVLNEGLERIVSFGAEPEPWDGEWTYVAFSVPEVQRSSRHQLRTKLRWFGFAPLYDGLWVSPRARPSEVLEVLEELEVGSATVIRGRQEGTGGDYGRAVDAWDLDEVRDGYLMFIGGMEPILQRLSAGGVSPAEALRARTKVMDQWRMMPNLDPELPTALLPHEWPRDEARAVFRRAYDGLGDPATVRVRQIVAAHDPSFVEHVQAHNIDGD